MKKISPDCILVNGANKSLIIDLTRAEGYHVDADFEHCEETMKMLVDEEVYVDLPDEVWKRLDYHDDEYITPYLIEDLVVKVSKNNFNQTIDYVVWLQKNFNIPNLAILFDAGLTINMFIEQLSIFDDLSIRDLTVITSFEVENDILKTLCSCFKIISVVQFDCAHQSTEIIDNTFVGFRKEPLKNYGVSFSSMRFDLKTYKKSLGRNTFYANKVFLNFVEDELSLTQSGTSVQCIKDVDYLNDFIKSNSTFWYIPKKDLPICTACEFRFSCYDDRVPTEKDNSQWGFEEFCNYDPASAAWET